MRFINDLTRRYQARSNSSTSLASLLVFTGFRLASPSVFRRTLAVGWDQLGVFLITVVGVLATDLLIGVAIGVIAEFGFHFWRSVNWSEVLRLRLGQGLQETGRLNDDGVTQALLVMHRYHVIAQSMGADPFEVLATAAVRDATNGPQFVAGLRARGQLELELGFVEHGDAHSGSQCRLRERYVGAREEVEAVALAGDVMPQKSTYFYPKTLDGLVIRTLDGPQA